MKTLALTTAAALVLSVPALAQTVERDTAPIGTTEFNTQTAFDRRDTNRDGVLDANEYDAGERRRYDRNRDGNIDADETAAYYGDDGIEANDGAGGVQTD